MSVMAETENNVAWKKELVTIVLDNRIVLQGKLKFRSKKDDCDKDCKKDHKDHKGFLFLELKCFPALIRDCASIETIEPPLFEIGEVVRINIDEIALVGTNDECLGDFDDDEDEDGWEPA